MNHNIKKVSAILPPLRHDWFYYLLDLLNAYLLRLQIHESSWYNQYLMSRPKPLIELNYNLIWLLLLDDFSWTVHHFNKVLWWTDIYSGHRYDMNVDMIGRGFLVSNFNHKTNNLSSECFAEDGFQIVRRNCIFYIFHVMNRFSLVDLNWNINDDFVGMKFSGTLAFEKNINTWRYLSHFEFLWS